MTDAVLNIDTLIGRPKIGIDGVLHEILSPDELPLLTSHRVAALGRKLDKLMKADELNATGQSQMIATLQELSGIIMEPVPATAQARLSDAQRMSVVEVFTMLSLARKAKLAGAMARRAMASTGEKPLPADFGDWADEREAVRLLTAKGGMARAVSHVLRPIAPALAMRGDIAGIADPRLGVALMVVEGASLVGPGAAGSERLPRPAMTMAWSAIGDE